MGEQPYESLVDHLRRAARATPNAVADSVLLEQFAHSADEEAFAELMQRFGPLVLGVCRRVLGHAHDAEDAFQATFLVLARKASSLRPGSAVGRWLYTVAVRTARKARTARLRRSTREGPLADVAAGSQDIGPKDWWPILDEELGHLGERDRAPLVLCDLLQRSRREAAAELHVPEGTLSSRLARAREKLRRRLERRGVSVPTAVLVTALAENAGVAAPQELVATVVRETCCRKSPIAGVVTSPIQVLAEGVLHSMRVQQLIHVCGAVLCAAVVGGGVGLGLAQQAVSEEKSAVAPTGPAPKATVARPKGDPARLRKLMQQRLDAVNRQIEGLDERVRLGKDPVIVLLDAYTNRLKAELELATDRTARLAAYEGHVERLKDVEELTRVLESAGMRARQEVAQVEYLRLDAEVQLERERLKQ